MSIISTHVLESLIDELIIESQIAADAAELVVDERRALGRRILARRYSETHPLADRQKVWWAAVRVTDDFDSLTRCSFTDEPYTTVYSVIGELAIERAAQLAAQLP